MVLQIYHLLRKFLKYAKVFHSNISQCFFKCWIFSENICDFDLFIAAPGCMSEFFPNPQQLEIFDASSEQIHCSPKFVPCVLLAQYEKYFNKYICYNLTFHSLQASVEYQE